MLIVSLFVAYPFLSGVVDLQLGAENQYIKSKASDAQITEESQQIKKSASDPQLSKEDDVEEDH